MVIAIIKFYKLKAINISMSLVTCSNILVIME